VRRRILLTIVATSALILMAFLVPLAILVGSVAETRATSAALLRVQALIPVVSVEPAQAADLTVQQLNNDGGPPITVFMPDGTVLGAPAPTTDAVQLASTGRTIVTDTPAGREIAIPIAGLPGGTAVIRVLVGPDQLEEGVVKARVVLLTLALVLMALAVAIGDTLARTFTRPLETAADAADRLAAGDLQARAEASGPHEIRSVAIALNRLAARILELLRAEREASADLSHRLRTPVTALRLDVEALPEGPERDRLTDDVTMISTSIDALIREAREPLAHGRSGQCDATAVITERLAFWAALAEDEGRTVTAAVPDHAVTVGASTTELAAAVDALLGNVFAHTPSGTAFTVELHPEPDGAELVVADEGPGLPATYLTQRGESTAGSTGLGLDIAARMAVRTGGRMQLGDADGGGALIRLHLRGPEDAD
jgi:signal transduction histidine kinase